MTLISRSVFVWPLVLAGALGCRDKPASRTGGQKGGKAPDATGVDGGKASGRAKPRLSGRSGELIRRIDALNPELRKAIASLDAVSLGRKGVKKPDPGKLFTALMELATRFPDSSDRLWTYYEKAASFLDQYAAMLKKGPKVDEAGLRALRNRFNAIVVAHNSARLDLSMLENPLPRPGSHGLDPLSYGHRVSKIGHQITRRLSALYHAHGGKADRGPRPARRRAMAFVLAVMRARRATQRALASVLAVRCRGDSARCLAVRKRVETFSASVRACVKAWDGLARDVTGRASRDEMRKRAGLLRRAHSQMVEHRVALPGAGR